MIMKYTYRYIARIILEAKTALFAGSGETSLLKDALVQKDYFGFPMIQGSSLTGVLRHALENQDTREEWKAFFGFQKKGNGSGSKVKISSAYLLFPDGKIAEKLNEDGSIPFKEYLSHFDNLPSRQHVRITYKGVADSAEGGLFENEVVYKGCRFIFEMEIKGDGSETNQWNALLNQLKNPLFRIGQGTRNGYGNLQIISCRQKKFNLNKEEDFQAYLHFDPSFNAANDTLTETITDLNFQSKALIHYELKLEPDAFFIFSSGYGDDQVDNQPLTEKVLVYNHSVKKLDFVSNTVFPASSIKGAISHRTCFHYYKLKGVYADKIDPLLHKNKTGINNKAVASLFGIGTGEINTAARGRVIIDDLYFDDIDNKKVINHVAINRFTGGAMQGALFSERVSQTDQEIKLNIYLEKKKEEDDEDEDIIKAFENTLKDICNGLLPLGGMTTKGHGIFTGQLFKDKIKMDTYEISI